MKQVSFSLELRSHKPPSNLLCAGASSAAGAGDGEVTDTGGVSTCARPGAPFTGAVH